MPSDESTVRPKRIPADAVYERIYERLLQHTTASALRALAKESPIVRAGVLRVAAERRDD